MGVSIEESVSRIGQGQSEEVSDWVMWIVQLVKRT
jgi:hypothetical protein